MDFSSLKGKGSQKWGPRKIGSGLPRAETNVEENGQEQLEERPGEVSRRDLVRANKAYCVSHSKAEPGEHQQRRQGGPKLDAEGKQVNRGRGRGREPGAGC